MRTRSELSLLCGIALAGIAAGCAFGPGEPMATVRPLLDARWVVPDGHALPDGFAALESGYELRVTGAVVGIEAFALNAEPAGGGGEVTFDPADPPPGYGGCHGGHCHREDGSLVTYEEIRAELAGGGGGESVVMTFPVAQEVDLLEGIELPLTCEPDCGLDASTLDELHAELSRILIRGVVRDGRTPPRIGGEVPFELELSDIELHVPLSIVISRERFPDITLGLRLHPGPQVFDEVDWAAPDPLGEEARAHVLEALGEAGLFVDITRRP